MINNTDSLYSDRHPVAVPEGRRDQLRRAASAWSSAHGGATRWMQVPGDPRNHYIARMEWARDSSERRSSSSSTGCRTRSTSCSPTRATGAVRTLLTDRDEAWVDVVRRLHAGSTAGKRFLWLERARRLAARLRWSRATAGDATLVTPGDVRRDRRRRRRRERAAALYYIASPDNPTQRYLLPRAARRRRARPSA